MALNFPNSPQNGDLATVGGKNYQYVSAKLSWVSLAYIPTTITPGTYGNAAEYPVITLNEFGFATNASTSPALSQASAIAFAIALG